MSFGLPFRHATAAQHVDSCVHLSRAVLFRAGGGDAPSPRGVSPRAPAAILALPGMVVVPAFAGGPHLPRRPVSRGSDTSRRASRFGSRALLPSTPLRGHLDSAPRFSATMALRRIPYGSGSSSSVRLRLRLNHLIPGSSPFLLIHFAIDRRPFSAFFFPRWPCRAWWWSRRARAARPSNDVPSPGVPTRRVVRPSPPPRGSPPLWHCAGSPLGPVFSSRVRLRRRLSDLFRDRHPRCVRPGRFVLRRLALRAWRSLRGCIPSVAPCRLPPPNFPWCWVVCFPPPVGVSLVHPGLTRFTLYACSPWWPYAPATCALITLVPCALADRFPRTLVDPSPQSRRCFLVGSSVPRWSSLHFSSPGILSR